MWIEPLELRSEAEHGLVLSSPDTAHAWVTERYSRALQAAAEVVLGRPTTIDVVAASTPEFVVPEPRRGTSVNPKHTFDQFVIGETNRLAHAAALAVAELPGQAYNPLFVCGPPGLGKTHLLHSIANFLAAHSPELRVRYFTIEEFTNAFVTALQNRSIDAFKARYRDVDVLLVDDVQFLASKVKTESEFFHTFNALYEIGSQLVLSSDRLPRDLDALEDRLRERFEAGLVTDIQPPDFATRLTILRMRAHRDELELTSDAPLELIANRVQTNVRALEGALIRVVAYHSLTGRPFTAELADEVLQRLYPGGPSATPTIADVQQVTARQSGVTVDELRSRSRAQRVVWPRQVAMYLARDLVGATLPAIGAAFGNRHHATVLYACRIVADRIAVDPNAFRLVGELTHALRSGTYDRRA